MTYKNKDLSLDEKAKIIGMLLEKTRQNVLQGIEQTERLAKEHPGLIRPELVKALRKFLNTEEFMQKNERLSELMESYFRAPDTYVMLRYQVFSIAYDLGWLEDKWDVKQIEKVLWLFVEGLYAEGWITKRGFNKIKKMTIDG